MPVLETKTFRVRADQKYKLDTEHPDRSSYLLRQLLDIFWKSKSPGLDVIALRTNVRLPELQFLQQSKGK